MTEGNMEYPRAQVLEASMVGNPTRRVTLTLSVLGPVILVVVISALGVGQLAGLLFRHGVAIGNRAYDVPLQAQELVTRGHLHHPTLFPASAYAVAAVSKVTKDSVQAVKLVVIMASVLLAGGLFLIVRMLTSSGWLGLLAVAIIAASPLQLLMAVNYKDTLLAVALLLWAAVFAFLFARGLDRRKYFYLAGGMVLCISALLSSPAAGITVIGLLVASWLVRPLAKDGPRITLWWSAAVVLAIWLAPIVLKHWGGRPSTFFSNYAMVMAGWREWLLLCLGSSILLVYIAVGRRTIDFRVACFAAFGMFALLVPLNPFTGNQGNPLIVADIIGSFTHIMAAIVIAGLVWMTKPLAGGRVSLTVGLFSLLLMLSGLSGPRTLPAALSDQELTLNERLIAGLLAQRPELPNDAFIVAPPGIDSLVTYTTGYRSSTEAPAVRKNGDASVFVLLMRVPPSIADPSMILLSAEGDYASVLLPEKNIENILDSVPPDLSTRLKATNPQLVRSIE